MESLLVVLDKKDMAVTLEGKSLKIRRPDVKPESVPLGLVGQVVIHGSPMVACNVWRALDEKGISAVIFPGRGTGGPTWMGHGLTTSVMVRKGQHTASEDGEKRDSVSRRMLNRKLAAQEFLIRQLAAPDENCPEDEEGAFVRATGLTDEALSEKAEDAVSAVSKSRSRLASASGRGVMMGHEGIAATAWFDFLGTVLPKHWKFKGRNRRPPKDPVNALLSLSYTLAMGEVRRAVHQRGLDPCIGFLHAAYPGRESFVLDVLEPLRPGADAFCLSLLDHVLEPKHFTNSRQDGCRLSKEGRSLYYLHWAQWRNSWPWRMLTENVQDMDTVSEENFSDSRDLPAARTSGSDSTKSLKVCAQWVIQEVTDLWPQPETGVSDG